MAPPRSHHRVPWPQQQCMQMGSTMTSYDVCRAAGWALMPRGVASGSFASANILLKSFVEHKGALSTLKRCTGASRNACAHCLRLTRACQGPLPSAPKVPPLLLTFAFFCARAGAVAGLELADRDPPVTAAAGVLAPRRLLRRRGPPLRRTPPPRRGAVARAVARATTATVRHHRSARPAPTPEPLQRRPGAASRRDMSVEVALRWL